jgi:hypothetical protein
MQIWNPMSAALQAPSSTIVLPHGQIRIQLRQNILMHVEVAAVMYLQTPQAISWHFPATGMWD